MTDRFSERYGYSPLPEQQPHDSMPGWVRDQIRSTIHGYCRQHDETSMNNPEHLSWRIYGAIGPPIWKVLDKKPPRNPMDGPWAVYIPRIIRDCEWWQLLDLCETVYALLSEEFGEAAAQAFGADLNDIFQREGLVWRLANGKIERTDESFPSQDVQKARALLLSSKFEGPSRQFEKAVGFLSARPNADPENCVKDAIGALEGVATILSGGKRRELDDLVQDLVKKRLVPPPLDQAIVKLYAYRGNAPGVGHSQVGSAQVGVEEAELVLGLVASIIQYLVRKAEIESIIP